MFLFLKCIRLASTFSVLIFSFAANADTAVNEYVVSANSKNLHKEPTWVGLLALDLSIADEAKNRFYLTSPFSPEKELEATIQGIFEPIIQKDIDNHIACRFPARFIWLHRHLKFPQALTNIQCPGHQQFLPLLNHPISFLYAGPSFSNPASSFGHILLKINDHSTRGASELIDTTINYGASIPQDIPNKDYLIKGLTGQFNGQFSVGKFILHDRVYTHHEQRNLWEYKLDFSDEDLDLLYRHLWEIKNLKFKYYFLTQNCAYIFAHLVSVAINELPEKQNTRFYTPRFFFDWVDELADRGVINISNIVWHPSLQNKVSIALRSQPEVVKQYFERLIEFSVSDFNFALSDIKSHINFGDYAKLLDMSLKYYQYFDALNKNNKKKLSDITTIRNILLKERINAVSTEILPEKTSFVSHENLWGSKLSRMSLSITGEPDEYSFGYDAISIDPADGFNFANKFSQLALLGIRIDPESSKNFVKELNLISVTSIKNGADLVPNHIPLSWSIELGAKLTHLSDKLRPFVSLGTGISTFSASNNYLISGFVNAEIRGEEVVIKPNLSGIYNFNPSLSAQIKTNKSFIHNSDAYTHSELSLSLRTKTDKVLKLFAAKTDGEQTRFALSINVYY